MPNSKDPHFGSLQKTADCISVYLLSVFLAIFIGVLPSFGLTEGDYTYTTNASGQATITDFTSTYTGPLFITNSLGGSPVIGIGNNAFESCAKLTDVTIPTSIATVGKYAFRYCYGLASVSIPECVTNIGEYAFYSCTNLSSVTIPRSVSNISNYAFQYCTRLNSVILSSGGASGFSVGKSIG